MAFTNAKSAGIGTTETTVYTAAAATTIIGLSVANVAAADITVTVKLGTTHIVKNAMIPVGSSLVVVGGDQKLVMLNTETIKVTSSAAASADVIMSMLV